jgi:hypothetical protein
MSVAEPAVTLADTDTITFDSFAHKSHSLDTVEQEALEAVAAEAVNRIYPESEATTQEKKRDRSRTLEEARKRARELVSFTAVDGPRKRIGAPGYIVIRASVLRADIQKIYERAGKTAKRQTNYKVMVCIAEEHAVERPKPWDVNDYSYDLRPNSKVAAALEQALIEAGIKVVNGNMLDEIKKVNVDFAKLDGADARIVQKIAAARGCHIVIMGNAKADGPSPRDIGLQQIFYYWKADTSFTAVFTDTAQTICSKNGVGAEDGDRIKMAGREKALVKAGEAIAGEFLRDFKPPEAATEIEVTITDVKMLDQADQLITWLEEIVGEGNVDANLDRGVFTAQLSTDMKALDLARKLNQRTRTDAAGFRLEASFPSPSVLKGRLLPAIGDSSKRS